MAVFYNPVITDAQGLDHGDPFVLPWVDGYYLYHTGVDGIHLYTSQDLVNWQDEGTVLRPADGEAHWAQTDLWAPEVLYYNGTFYMYVAATRRQEDGRGDDMARRLGIARSRSPRGPWQWDSRPLVHWEWSIDGHPFQDDDGSLWLFYNVRNEATRYSDGTIGCGNVVDRLLHPAALSGVQTPVAFPSERWEGNRDGTWYWNEGAFTLKRRGVYYQMYSGGFFADDTYGIGFAAAADLRGPWEKYEGNPIYRSTDKIMGPGHHCVVTGPDGWTLYVVYHGYIPAEAGRKVHIDRLYWVGDRVAIVGPTADEQPVPFGPVYEPDVPHWHLSAWVRGKAVLCAGSELALPDDDYHHLRIAWMNGRLRAWIDKVLRISCACRQHPDIQVDGTLTAVARQTCWDDDGVYELPAGTVQCWQWGGRQPLELSAAVRGSAVVCADSRQLAVVESDDYQLVTSWIDCGADIIEVKAGDGGAVVADVTLAARRGKGMQLRRK